jgi:uncharacterized membrane protein
MSRNAIIKLYAVGLVSFLVIDITWVGLVAKDFYWNHLSHLLVDRARMAPALLLYAGLVAGNLWLAVLPGLEKGSLPQALKRAGVLGLLTYGTYDLTNQALTIDWPWVVTVVDMVWGMCVHSVIGAIMYIYGAKLKGRVAAPSA